MKYITEDGEILDTNCEDCITFMKTPTNHDTLRAAQRGALECKDPSKTDQSFVEEADINKIVERLKLGMTVDVPLPEHFGEDRRIDLYAARTRIAESNATFYNLPASIRNEFQNDPSRWEQQVLRDLDDGNRANLRRMGLDIPEPAEPPQAGTPAPGAPGTPGGALAPPETPQNGPKGP